MDIAAHIISREHLDRYRDMITVHARQIVYGGLFAAIVVWLFAARLSKRKYLPINRPNSPDPEKPSVRQAGQSKTPQRTPGEWAPVDFKRPRTTPLQGWDVHSSEPLPYRPFRHSPYHITMGLRTMQWDEWIELDNHYLRFHADKSKRIIERGDKCCRTAPEAVDAAVELLEEL